MKITFLGTGTSQGIPVIGCRCPVCTSSDARDNRLRSSVLVETQGMSVLIDCGPDFRYQMLREKVSRLDAILFTHEHKDHIAGLDDVRAFNYMQGRGMDVYALPRVQEALKREFHYAFMKEKYPGVPLINLHDISTRPFQLGDLAIVPIEVMHYRLPILGFRIGGFTYITDAKTIAPPEVEKIKGSQVLVLNALQQGSHISHFTLSEAIAFSRQVNVPHTYLTHVGHNMGLHQEVSAMLPPGVSFAYDGLKIEV